MHKIFHKNTIKISYSCMRNIDSIFLSNNKNILNPKQISFGSNYRNKENCPLNGECVTSNIIYCANITATRKPKFYFGTSEITFKQRHSNHSHDIKYIKYQHSTELAKYL